MQTLPPASVQPISLLPLTRRPAVVPRRHGLAGVFLALSGWLFTAVATTEVAQSPYALRALLMLSALTEGASLVTTGIALSATPRRPGALRPLIALALAGTWVALIVERIVALGS